MEIRSYRRVFDLERRIYRIDQMRLNPSGIPVRGIAYALAAVALVLVCGRLPLLAPLSVQLPWFVRDLVLPLAAAGLFTVIRIDGRRFDQAAEALLRNGLGRRRGVSLRAATGSAGCWRPPALLVLADGSDCRLRRVRFDGPGAVRVVARHEREPLGWRHRSRFRRRALVVLRAPRLPRQSGGGRVIVLDRDTRLRIH
jgi:hypothetical protein